MAAPRSTHSTHPRLGTGTGGAEGLRRCVHAVDPGQIGNPSGQQRVHGSAVGETTHPQVVRIADGNVEHRARPWAHITLSARYLSQRTRSMERRTAETVAECVDVALIVVDAEAESQAIVAVVGDHLAGP